MTMTAGAVAEVLDALDASGVQATVAGGWAIDALVGRQRRPHDDLDLVVFEASLDELRVTVRPLGFEHFSGVRRAGGWRSSAHPRLR